MKAIVNAPFWPTDCEFSLEDVIQDALSNHIDSLVCDGVLEDYVEFNVFPVNE